jgi:hypothetical protein
MQLAGLARRMRTYWPSALPVFAGLVVWLGLTTAAARGVKVTTYRSPSGSGDARTVRWYGWVVVDSDHPALLNQPDEFVRFEFWGLCGFAALAVAVPAWKLAEVFRHDAQQTANPGDDAE